MIFFIIFCVIIIGIFLVLRHLSNQNKKMHDKLEDELIDRYRIKHQKKKDRKIK